MKYLAILLFTAILTSCQNVQENTSPQMTQTVEDFTQSQENISGENDFIQSDADLNIKTSDTIYITLDSENTNITSDSLQISDQVITIKKSGNYEFTGKLDDGQIVIETDDEKDVQIILNNAEITNSAGSAILVENAQQAVITLAADSQNILTDADEYSDQEEDSPNAVIFSRDDLVITGEGSLIVNANYNDGITSKDDLFINSGNITVNAIDDGIRGKNLLSILGGDISISSQGDGLKSDDEDGSIEINGGNIEISSGDDAVNAEKSIYINGGNLNVLSSYEAIESAYIVINAGNIYLRSSDDGINVTSEIDENTSGKQAQDIFLEIHGGNITLNAGGDGLDSNGNIIMTGGNVIVHGPTEDNNGALDYNGAFEISGGVLLALGSSGMATAPSANSIQNSILIGFDTTYTAGTKISLKDSQGNELFSTISEKSFQSVALSSPEIIQGSEYTLELNSEVVETFTISETLTQIGETGRSGGGGGLRR